MRRNINAPAEGMRVRLQARMSLISQELGVQSFCSAWDENFLSIGKRLDGFEVQLISQEDEVRGLGIVIRGWFGQFPRSDDHGFDDSAPGQE
ncbi:hypothetical protein PIB30_088165 [Stylosanthes scabra]|uniref:Uncharacterized protein n=1 Tax=Stylosanthes scabra TaxID=79078 RepID=A0ABU6USJ5_9FABA|nr:hypothetical protein [Stylosanthes scabra]